MAGRAGQTKTKLFSKIKSGLKLKSCQRLGATPDEIVDVSHREIFSALTVEIALAGHTGVERAWKGRKSSPEKIHDGPNDSLCCKSRGAIPKRESTVQENFAAPANGKEDGGHRVEDKPSIPTSEINLEKKNSLAGISGPGFLDKVDDGLGVR